MKPQTLKVLGAAFVLLLIVSILLFWPREEKQTDLPKSLFTTTPTEATEIQLKKGSDTVTLLKKETEWKVDDYKANDEKISKLLNSLNNLKLDRRVSLSAENHEQYAVGTESGTLISIKTGDKTDEVYIGNSGPSAGTFYIRKDGENDVYLAAGDVLTNLTISKSGWIDKRIVLLGKDAIVKIEITDALSGTIEKKENDWNITKKGTTTKLEDAAKDTVLNSIANLEGYDVATAEKQTIFKNAKSRITIKVTGADGKDSSEFTAVKDGTDYLVQKADDPTMYLVNAATLDPLLKMFE